MERDDIRQANVLAIQIETLFRSAPASVLSIVGSLMAVAVYWAPGLRAGLVAFVSVVSIISFVHIGVALLWRSGRLARLTPAASARVMDAIYLSSGLAWGIGAAWMNLNGDGEQAAVACCLVMGAVTVTFPAVVYPRALNLFQGAILLPAAGALSVSTMTYGPVLAAGALLLSVVIALISRGIGGQLTAAVLLSVEHARISAVLEERGEALQAANRELAIQSLTDPLTGAANRRQLMTALRAAPANCALLVIDVDHFKSYNDAFGHSEGDTCLVLVAEALHRSARQRIDVVARQGGEEFAMLLPQPGEQVALEIAERARRNVEALLETRPNMLRRRVTVSVGVAVRNAGRPCTVDRLMELADEAVYAAKRAGRNCVSLPEGTVGATAAYGGA